MEKGRKRILELVAEGVVSAVEAASLLHSLDHKSRARVLKLKISSSQQTVPVLEISISIAELPELLKSIHFIAESGLQFLFQKGRFRLDFRELNWSRILELALQNDADNIYFYESRNEDGDTVSLQIWVES
ncbi:MAG: hypothetical protein K9M99_02080 [Candidatus Cloacimonetes bacterium]|nr:hypothetical protein [Candidatus Cloacimonadota bacterium]